MSSITGLYALLSLIPAALAAEVSTPVPPDTLAKITVGTEFTKTEFSCQGATCRREGLVAGERGEVIVDLCGETVRGVRFAIKLVPAGSPVAEGILAGLDPGPGFRIFTSPEEVLSVGDQLRAALNDAGWTALFDEGLTRELPQGSMSTWVYTHDDGRTRSLAVSAVELANGAGKQLLVTWALSADEHKETCLEGLE